MFTQRRPLKLRSDAGSEFNNKYLKKYPRDIDVYYVITQYVPKASYVERVQKTIKVMMYGMMENHIAIYYFCPHVPEETCERIQGNSVSI